jgi:anti-anti-sigma regulatory factor
MQTEDTGNRVVVQLGSRKASDVGNDLRDLADAHKGRTLEIDMAAVRIINADAVSALVFLHAQAGKDGGRLLLSHVHGFVRAVFRVTNTDSLFEIVEEEGEPCPVVT